MAKYGFNFDFGLAQALLTLAPHSTLELGCGLGLYTSFLQRMRATAPSIGIEPQPMPSSIFGSNATPWQNWPEQLVGNFVVLSHALRDCDSALARAELVFSIEVAERAKKARPVATGARDDRDPAGLESNFGWSRDR